MEDTNFDDKMTRSNRDCDYLNGDNAVQYDNCYECYRYEICKEFYKKNINSVKEKRL